jgi:capsular exopolysaccharide synthesis family protein
MRSPRVCDLLAIKKRGVHGLSEYLAGIDAEPNIISTIHDNLFLLPAGAESVNTPGLLCSKRMASLMELCKGKFDYIIFDTPPVNIVSDAILLKDCVDGYLLVTRGDFSDVNSVSDAVDSLTTAEAKIFGFVLASYDAKKGAKYGKYGRYGGYYGYGQYGYGGYGYGEDESHSNSRGSSDEKK